jgi:hypothetical protein
MKVICEFETKLDDKIIKDEYEFYINEELEIKLVNFNRYQKEGKQKKFREKLKYQIYYNRSNNIDLPTIVDFLKNNPKRLTEIKDQIFNKITNSLKNNINLYF